MGIIHSESDVIKEQFICPTCSSVVIVYHVPEDRNILGDNVIHCKVFCGKCDEAFIGKCEDADCNRCGYRLRCLTYKPGTLIKSEIIDVSDTSGIDEIAWEVDIGIPFQQGDRRIDAFELSREVEEALRPACHSGSGFGFRDMQIQFETKDEAFAAEQVAINILASHGVEIGLNVEAYSDQTLAYVSHYLTIYPAKGSFEPHG